MGPALATPLAVTKESAPDHQSTRQSLNPSRSLRARLALTFGATTSAFVIFISAPVGSAAERQRAAQTGQDLAALARTLAGALDRGMFERHREIRLVASIETLTAPDVTQEEQRQLMEMRQRTFPSYAWLGFVRPDGVVRAGTGGVLEGMNISQRPVFARGASGVFVGDVHKAELLSSLLPSPSGEPMRFLDVSAPVVDDNGDVRGILAAHLTWRWAQEVHASILDSTHAAQATIRRHVVTSSRRHVVTSSRRHVVTSSRRHVVTSSRRHVVTSSRRHGGSVAIESHPGGGTGVLLRFPHVELTRSAEGVNGQAAPSRPAPLRVLIVDDDPQVRQITEALVRAEGHTVTAASDGVEALAAFETGTFDLVVTDRAMPRMGGDQLAVAIKGRSPTTSIILLTGFGDLMDAGEKPPGVDAVLGKQATISRLRDAVTRVVPVPAAVT